jgi:hypothetical protein
MDLITEIKNIWYRTKYNLQQTVNPKILQISGLVLIVCAYFAFGLKHPYIGWFGFLVPVGIFELALIFIWKTTITKRGRKLFRKEVDLIISLGLIAITWWWFSPLAAGLYFIGLLSSHFSEKQS